MEGHCCWLICSSGQSLSLSNRSVAIVRFTYQTVTEQRSKALCRILQQRVRTNKTPGGRWCSRPPSQPDGNMTNSTARAKVKDRQGTKDSIDWLLHASPATQKKYLSTHERRTERASGNREDSVSRCGSASYRSSCSHRQWCACLLRVGMADHLKSSACPTWTAAMPVTMGMTAATERSVHTFFTTNQLCTTAPTATTTH